jgi:hypothetical protein
MKVTKKKSLLYSVIALVFLLVALPITGNAASLQTRVEIKTSGQVVDSFNGVEAKYIPGTGNSNTGTYSCAGYVKAYYSTVYGITVSNLLTGKTPNASNGSFSVTDTPEPGDIGYQLNSSNSGHWFIIKEVNDSDFTVIEQNWKWEDEGNTYCYINRHVSFSETSGFKVFRWSERTSPTISNFKLSASTFSVGEQLSFSGIISGNGDTIKAIQLSIFDADDHSVGVQLYRSEPGTATFDLSRVPSYTIGSNVGSTSYKTEAGNDYDVFLYVTLTGGGSFGSTPPSRSFTVSVAEVPELIISNVQPNKTSANVGDTLTWTATATGGSGALKYCFYVFKNGTVVERGSYGTAKTYAYTPTAAGAYTVRVYVKDGAGTVATQDNAAKVNVTASATPLTISSVKANKTSANTGESITWTATATGGSGTLKYCFYVFRNDTVVERGSYGTARTYTYTPQILGIYTVRVYVKDGTGTSINKTSDIVLIDVFIAPDEPGI